MVEPTKEEKYKAIIAESLSRVIRSGWIPELGKHKSGKVRELHFHNGLVYQLAFDRVSAFDVVSSQLVPYKGQVLNRLNVLAMDWAQGIVKTAHLGSPDPAMIVQREHKNVGFECVVRGYLWGSAAKTYETGERVISGVEFKNDMLRYQKLDEPVFTPTTKAEVGHDESVTLEDIATVHGPKVAQQLKDISIALYKKGAEEAEKKGKRLLDTKFEFGFDEMNNLVLIDECMTPDSSRYADSADYEKKMPEIEKAMGGGTYKNVTELLKAKPEMAITEESKELFREAVKDAGYDNGDTLPIVSDEAIIETAFQYINLCESLTGEDFQFTPSDLPVERRIMRSLVQSNQAYGGCVIPMLASIKDGPHWEKMKGALDKEGVPYTEPTWDSAEKKTREVLAHIDRVNGLSIEPVVFLTAAGRGNTIGGLVAGNTEYPVITCPVFSDSATYQIDVNSSLRRPSGVPVMTVLDPGNAAGAAKRMLDMARVN
tara:strand:- start:472 stop:1926 length:1455 start_codon:yes stop_codon:yes gene_type:complete